jgi:hypothetical protein
LGLSVHSYAPKYHSRPASTTTRRPGLALAAHSPSWTQATEPHHTTRLSTPCSTAANFPATACAIPTAAPPDHPPGHRETSAGPTTPRDTARLYHAVTPGPTNRSAVASPRMHLPTPGAHALAVAAPAPAAACPRRLLPGPHLAATCFLALRSRRRGHGRAVRARRRPARRPSCGGWRR